MNRRGFFGALVGGIAAATGVRSLASLPLLRPGSRITFLKSAAMGKTDQTLVSFGADLQVLAEDATVDPREFAHWRDIEHWSRPSVAAELVQGQSGDLHALQEALPHHGIVGDLSGVHGVELVLGGVDDGLCEPVALQHHAHDELQSEVLAAEERPFLNGFIVHQTLPSSSNPVNALERDAVPVADLPTIWPGRFAAITATVALPPLAQVDRLVEMFGASGEDAPAFAAALIGELVLTRMRLAAADPKTLWGLES